MKEGNDLARFEVREEFYLNQQPLKLLSGAIHYFRIQPEDWYQNLMQYIPDGKLFSWRSVFDGIPRIVQQLPTTLMLTVFGAFFGIMLALLFAIVKINRVRILYPLQAFFVSFLKGTPILVQLMLTYYGIPLALKALNQQWGTAFNINAIPAAAFAIVAFAFNEAAYASETIRAAILLSLNKAKDLNPRASTRPWL